LVFDGCAKGHPLKCLTVIETSLMEPGKPWQKGANESFNGNSRHECLGKQCFEERIDAKVVIEDWQ